MAAAEPTLDPLGRRVLFRGSEAETTRDARCRARITLEWSDGASFSGEAIGNTLREGRMRAGALATLEALRPLLGDRLQLQLTGAKSVPAFDTVVVIVALRARAGERRMQLIGSAAAPEGDLVHGAALAVLNASNRLLEAHAVVVPPESDA